MTKENNSHTKDYPTLTRMNDAGVFSVQILDDGMIEFMDGCDGCFWATLTAEEVLSLAEELKRFASKTSQK